MKRSGSTMKIDQHDPNNADRERERERVDNVSQQQHTYHNESGTKKDYQLGYNEVAGASMNEAPWWESGTPVQRELGAPERIERTDQDEKMEASAPPRRKTDKATTEPVGGSGKDATRKFERNEQLVVVAKMRQGSSNATNKTEWLCATE
jgi:hypothetical protein